MRPIIIWLGLIILEIGLYQLGPKENYEILSPQPAGLQIQIEPEAVFAVGVETEIDPTIPKIQRFLDEYGAPDSFDAVSLVGVARRHGLRPDLLVLVGCVESSCGKRFFNNPFGFGSDARWADWGDIEADAEHVASRIAAMEHYREWKNGDQLDLGWFASLYNYPYRKSYAEKLNYFYRRIEEQK